MPWSQERQNHKRSLVKDTYYRTKLRELVQFSNRDILKQWSKLIQFFIYGFLTAVIINFIAEIIGFSNDSGGDNNSLFWFQRNLPLWYQEIIQDPFNRFDSLLETNIVFKTWMLISITAAIIILSIRYYNRMKQNILRITNIEILFFFLLGFLLFFKLVGYDFYLDLINNTRNKFKIDVRNLFQHVPLLKNFFPINWTIYYSTKDVFLPHLYLLHFYLFIYIIGFRSIFLLKSVLTMVGKTFLSIIRPFKALRVARIIIIGGGIYFIIAFIASINLILSNVWLSPDFIYFLALTSLFVYFFTIKYQIIFELINNELVKKIIILPGRAYSQIRRKIGFISLVGFDVMIVFASFTVYSAFYSFFSESQFLLIISAAIVLLAVFIFWIIFFDLMKWKGWEGLDIRGFIVLLVGILIFGAIICVSAWTKIISDHYLADIFIWSGWVFIILYISLFFQIGSASVVNKLITMIDFHSPYVDISSHPHTYMIMDAMSSNVKKQFKTKINYISDYIIDHSVIPLSGSSKIFHIVSNTEFSQRLFINSLKEQLTNSRKKLDIGMRLHNKWDQKNQNRFYWFKCNKDIRSVSLIIENIANKSRDILGWRNCRLLKRYLEQSIVSDDGLGSTLNREKSYKLIEKLQNTLRAKKVSIIIEIYIEDESNRRVMHQLSRVAESISVLKQMFLFLQSQSITDFSHDHFDKIGVIDLPKFQSDDLFYLFKWQYTNFMLSHRLYHAKSESRRFLLPSDQKNQKKSSELINEEAVLKKTFDTFTRQVIIDETKNLIEMNHATRDHRIKNEVVGFEYHYLADLLEMMDMKSDFCALYQKDRDRIKKYAKLVILSILKDNKKLLLNIEKLVKEMMNLQSAKDIKPVINNWLIQKHVNSDHIIELSNEIVRCNFILSDDTISSEDFKQSLKEVVSRT